MSSNAKRARRQDKRAPEAGWSWRFYASIVAIVVGVTTVIGGGAALIKHLGEISRALKTVLHWVAPSPNRLTLRDIDLKAELYLDPHMRMETVGAWTYRILAVGEKEGSAHLTGCFGQMKWGQDWFRGVQNEQFPIYEFGRGAVQSQMGFLFYVDPASWRSGLGIPGGPQFRVVCSGLVTATHSIKIFPAAE
jgi:hypothetical protein